MNGDDDSDESAISDGDGVMVAAYDELMRIGFALLESGALELPASRPGAVRPVAMLTPRQEKIRTLLRQGMSNKVIGAELGISEGTVKNHISEIFRILKVTNRTQAAQADSADGIFTGPHSRELRNIMYDLDEYLHLALHANTKRDPHACIGYLKEALRVEPQNAKAIYLLAIQHAEIGLIDRGIAGLTKVLLLEPTFEIARLQLGLLLLDRGRATEALDQFAASRNSADPAVREFTEGMILAVDGQIAAASEKMKASLSMPVTNAALPLLVQGVLTRLVRLKPAEGQPGKQPSQPESDKRISLGAYETAIPAASKLRTSNKAG
jgi:DNA-binding CsgD family transcriptional regulator